MKYNLKAIKAYCESDKVKAIRALKVEGYSASVLREAGYSASELRGAGYSANALLEAGYSASALVEAGYSANALVEAGYSASALRGAGYSASALRGEGYSANALRGAGYSARALREAGYSASALLEAGYSASSIPTIPVIQLPYTKILKAIEANPSCHRQSTFGGETYEEHHACGTAMCTAGHLVALSGLEGWELKEKFGWKAAASMLHQAAHPGWPCQDFGVIPDKDAMEYIKEMAEREAKL